MRGQSKSKSTGSHAIDLLDHFYRLEEAASDEPAG
jgi:hypothetical protein